MKRWREKVKAEVYALYGGKCGCCSETDIRFMTMDHTENDGAVARTNSSRTWKDARDRFGDGYYAMVCFNCNTGRHINGGVCPHQDPPVTEG